ncbi:MAG: PH domain-containing protein [Gemmatimonadota bacterium]
MNPLHPRIIVVWRLAGLLAAVFLAAAVGAFEHWVLARENMTLIAPGVLTGLVAILGLALALFWPPLRYRCWRWEVLPDRVLIQRGVIWRSRSLIPRVRVQHVDTRTSPLQRWLGLSSLIIYTAGTRGADAEIPGLAAEEAERLREELARVEELDERA